MPGTPRVGIGLPVYNGEKHLAFALDSILNQTFGDFELIVSDNASTDRTEEICRDYARRDTRLRYIRNSENLGASRNYNRVFELSRARDYFRWNAHDDTIAPTHLEKCVKALDESPPTTVMAVPRRRYITWEEGRVVGSAWEAVAGASTEDGLDPGRPTFPLDSYKQIDFAKLLRLGGGWFPMLAFCLCRIEALRKTRLLCPFPGADRILIAEIRILGEFVEVPEELYFQRLHPSTGWTGRKNLREEIAWFNPRGRTSIIPVRWGWYLQYLKAIHMSPVGWRNKTARYADLANRLLLGSANRTRRLLRLRPPAIDPVLRTEAQSKYV
jgi:glycosyltransferase involved in cell wall biosynthesis